MKAWDCGKPPLVSLSSFSVGQIVIPFGVNAMLVYDRTYEFHTMILQTSSTWAWMSIFPVDTNEVRSNIVHGLTGWWDLHFSCMQALLSATQVCLEHYQALTSGSYIVPTMSGINDCTFITTVRVSRAKPYFSGNRFFSPDSCKDRKHIYLLGILYYRSNKQLSILWIS